jgi:hypothetical protein
MLARDYRAAIGDTPELVDLEQDGFNVWPATANALPFNQDPDQRLQGEPAGHALAVTAQEGTYTFMAQSAREIASLMDASADRPHSGLASPLVKAVNCGDQVALGSWR